MKKPSSHSCNAKHSLRHSESLSHAPARAAEPFVGGCWRINFSRVVRWEGEKGAAKWANMKVMLFINMVSMMLPSQRGFLHPNAPSKREVVAGLLGWEPGAGEAGESELGLVSPSRLDST